MAPRSRSPQQSVGTIRHDGRIRTYIDIPLTVTQRTHAFRQIDARSNDLALPTEYTEFVERLAQQSEQLVHVLEQTKPSRKHVVVQNMDHLRDAREALPHMLHGFVRARIDAANRLSAHYGKHHVYKEAESLLHDALVNAKWRLPVSERSGPSVPEIISAISDKVDALIKDTMNEMRTARAHEKRR